MQRIDRYVVHLSVLDRTQRNAGISSALGKSAGEPQAQKPSLISFPVPLRASADLTRVSWHIASDATLDANLRPCQKKRRTVVDGVLALYQKR